jgi:hypothetical protein
MNTAYALRRTYAPAQASSSVEVVAPEDLASKPPALALRYWNALRGTRPFPAREDIVPRDMAPFLRNVVLARVIDGGRDYEYRIAGEAFVHAFGDNFKGKCLSQVEAEEPDYGRATRAVYEYVRNLGQPFALRGAIAAAVVDARFSYHETVFLPLGTDGVVEYLLVTTMFTPRSTDAAQTPLSVVLPASYKGYGLVKATA